MPAAGIALDNNLGVRNRFSACVDQSSLKKRRWIQDHFGRAGEESVGGEEKETAASRGGIAPPNCGDALPIEPRLEHRDGSRRTARTRAVGRWRGIPFRHEKSRAKFRMNYLKAQSGHIIREAVTLPFP